MMKLQKIALGTVQFGLAYGIKNSMGQVPAPEVKNILENAFRAGIDTIDTAYAYGTSEAVLGSVLSEITQSYTIISKFPAKYAQPQAVIEESFSRLRQNQLYGYLFHDFSTYLDNPEILQWFIRYKNEGKIKKIGFSLYYPHQAQYILDNNVPCDIVQIPYSIFDQRFEPLFQKMVERSIEIHVRSVFLQGLLLFSPDKLPLKFTKCKEALIRLAGLAAHNNQAVASLCLNFALHNDYISKVVIGVDNLDNLEENIRYASNDIVSDTDYIELMKFAIDDEQLLLPFNWEKLNV